MSAPTQQHISLLSGGTVGLSDIQFQRRDSNTLDAERIIAMKSDLVVAWSSDNSASQLDTLRVICIPVFESELRDFRN